MVELIWHSYRYYPYERELARREVEALFPEARLSETEKGIKLSGEIDTRVAKRLVYFASAQEGATSSPTTQSRLERVNGNGVNRQSTRYSAHGLHEYKGKFNPQIVRAILNIFDIPDGGLVLDPFCGSGTALLECSHLGLRAVGLDINPLAVFIANAKLGAVRVPAQKMRTALRDTLKRYKAEKLSRTAGGSERREYLLSWFEPGVFETIERVRIAIQKVDGMCRGPLLAIASDQLREYSHQDPNDLRIRRRKSPLPAKPFVEAFEEAVSHFVSKLEDAQSIVRKTGLQSEALLRDSQSITADQVGIGSKKFDCAVTSPPYATALPYIDTQRLSLVWLGLIPPSEILPLESRLVGSRELRGTSKRAWIEVLRTNGERLPPAQVKYCLSLDAALSDKDGFRRQAVPVLLYRYLAGMAASFRSVRPLMKKGAPFALIVGTNHTTLGGQRFDINTPKHLTQIAADSGWKHVETFPLQTYQRYGYHMGNAVADEALIILRAA